MKNMSAEKVMDDTIDYMHYNYGKVNNISKNNPLKVVQSTVFIVSWV